MQHLRELIPPETWQGASLLAAENGRFWFAGKIKNLEGETVLALTGIGGKVEPGESFLDCVLRETTEETGTTAEIMPCSETLVVRGKENGGFQAVEGGPAAVVFRSGCVPPGEPWVPGHPLAVAVFLGRLAEAPRPVEKLPVFVLLGPGEIMAILSGRRNWKDVKEACPVVTAPGLDLAGTVRVLFTDSPEALFLHLGPRTPAFLSRLSVTSSPVAPPA